MFFAFLLGLITSLVVGSTSGNAEKAVVVGVVVFLLASFLFWILRSGRGRSSGGGSDWDFDFDGGDGGDGGGDGGD